MSKMQEPPKVTAQEQPNETTNESPKVTPQSLVSEDLVRAALTADKGTDAEIVSWEVKDFTNKGDNYACVVTSVSVRYRQGSMEGEVSYVAKCNPCKNVIEFNMFTNMVFEKEGKFYEQLVPLVNAELIAIGQEPLRMADCYVTHFAKDKEVILMEDLRSNGFRMFDRKKGMDEAHVTLVVRELARLHAASTLIQAKMTEPMEEKYPFLKKDFGWTPEDYEDKEKGKKMFELMFYGNMKIGLSMAEKVGGYDQVVDWLRRNVRQGQTFFERCLEKSPPFDVLCHGDCWNNNILFKYDESGQPVDVRLLDLQICRKASPATDLNYFMYTSLNGPVRRNNLEAFLKSYYDAFNQVFSQAGRPTPFTLQELKREYHDKNVFGLIMGLMVVPLVVVEANDVVDIDDESGNVDNVMEKFHKGLLDSVENNPLLRPRLLATFDDMVEYGVIS